jgi:hypothetical protein
MLLVQNFQTPLLKNIKDLRNLSGGLCPHSALLGSATAYGLEKGIMEPLYTARHGRAKGAMWQKLPL